MVKKREDLIEELVKGLDVVDKIAVDSSLDSLIEDAFEHYLGQLEDDELMDIAINYNIVEKDKKDIYELVDDVIGKDDIIDEE